MNSSTTTSSLREEIRFEPSATAIPICKSHSLYSHIEVPKGIKVSKCIPIVSQSLWDMAKVGQFATFLEVFNNSIRYLLGRCFIMLHVH